MLVRLLSLSAAIIVPYLIFAVVVGLNDGQDIVLDDRDGRVAFDVERRQQQIEQPKPKPPPQRRRQTPTQPLPAIKPSSALASIGGSGLSFGIPQFDEAEFDDVNDDDLLSDFGNQNMDQDSVDTPPRVKRRSPIVYPELARRQGINGHVTLNVLVDESGNVEDVKIVESKPDEIFDLMADSNIRRWKFEPATYNGRKVKVWATQKIVFRLN